MSIDNIEKLIDHITIETTAHYQVKDEKINETSPPTDTELEEWWTKNYNKKIKSESSLYSLLENITSSYENDEFLDLIYNTKYRIGLHASLFRDKYFNEILGITDISSWSEEKRNEFYDNNPDDISTRKLRTTQPEIYKLGYIDKIKIKGVLITNIILKIMSDEIKLKSFDGFTLNEMAYLASKYYKLLFWQYDLSDGCLFMESEKQISADTLIFGVGCD